MIGSSAGPIEDVVGDDDKEKRIDCVEYYALSDLVTVGCGNQR